MSNSTLVPEEKQKVFDRVLFKRLFKYTKGYRHLYLLVLFLTGINTVCDIINPYLYGLILAVLGEDNPDFNKVLMYVLLSCALVILVVLLTYFQEMTLHRIGNKIVYDLRAKVFDKIESLSVSQLNEMPVGKQVTRVGNDVNVLYQLYTRTLVNLIRQLFSVVGVVIAMFVINYQLALLAMISAPIVLVISIIFRKYSRRAHRRVRNAVSDMNAYLNENISGMKVTQIFNQEKKKAKEFDVKNKEYLHASMKEIVVFAIFRPSIYMIYVLMIVLVLWTGSNQAIDVNLGVIQVGITYSLLYTFYQYIEKFFWPLQQMAEQFNQLQSAFAAAERIFAVLDTVPEIRDSEDAIDAGVLKGEIEFKDVWFKYVDDEWVLKGVSFKINAKDTVAFVGSTGSGKSTILSLIVRNYDIQKGQILIDGRDIKDYKIASLRRNVGQMLQDVFLFSGTILSNIQLKDESISLDAVKEASTYVNANKFIEALPKQYDEEVRERGNNFSSGQRQLLSFARTIVHKPNIMILDEATANIDSETELLIQDSLEKMMNIGTMLIVAHRLSTIQHADKIIVLSHGEIIEQGNHQELLALKGKYYKLYQLQYHHNLLKDKK